MMGHHDCSCGVESFGNNGFGKPTEINDLSAKIFLSITGISLRKALPARSLV